MLINTSNESGGHFTRHTSSVWWHDENQVDFNREGTKGGPIKDYINYSIRSFIVLYYGDQWPLAIIVFYSSQWDGSGTYFPTLTICWSSDDNRSFIRHMFHPSCCSYFANYVHRKATEAEGFVLIWFVQVDCLI